MIKRIKRLDKITTNKIAAGEVVERPASVVKELIENSIDAKAKSITIEIKNAGKSYIRISDDGIGIHKDDIEIAFERHATSKISNDKDIYNLYSLGFRGEALASIASVSNVEIITRTIDETSGIRAELRNGTIVYKNQIGCPIGTSIIVKDLFYNTPARYKFLKSNSAETNNISILVNKLALSHPEISFRYIVDNKNIFSTPGNNDMYSTIASIYDKELVKNLIKIYKKSMGVELKGFISNLNYSRGNRQLQSLFVNGRYVQNKIITQAIDKAYKTLLPLNRFSVCFLYLNIGANEIDVNIHPAKTEIRFHKEDIVKNIVYDTIKDSLLQSNLIPNINIITNENIKNKKEHHLNYNKEENIEEILDISKQLVIDVNQVVYEKEDIEAYKKQKDVKDDKKIKNTMQSYINEALEKMTFKNNKKYIDNSGISNKPLEVKFFEELKIIGQLFSTYVICEKNEKMFLIDQHAAHERILYEKYLNSYFKSEVISQILLEPIIIQLNYLDKENLLQNIKVFENLGYKVDEFGYNTVILREVPIIFGAPVAKNFFINVLEKLSNNPKNNYEFEIERIIQTACKNAIKAKDSLKNIEVDKLIRELEKLENPFTCPHGRPTIISISKGEIEKKFMRT